MLLTAKGPPGGYDMAPIQTAEDKTNAAPKHRTRTSVVRQDKRERVPTIVVDPL